MRSRTAARGPGGNCLFDLVPSVVGFPGYSCHGPRHLAGAALAEAGATVDEINEIMSLLGHTTQEMVRLYVQQANRKIIAKNAMKKWEQATNERG
jgi:integrase